VQQRIPATAAAAATAVVAAAAVAVVKEKKPSSARLLGCPAQPTAVLGKTAADKQVTR
jgi:hypothetical protein